MHLATSTSYSGHKPNRNCVGSLHTSAFTDFFQQPIVSADPQLEGFSPHELRPQMLLPAATLPGNAGCFQGLLGALEASAVAVLGKAGRVEISSLMCQFQVQLTA